MLVLCLSVLLVACKKKKEDNPTSTTPTKGDRTLGMSINLPSNNDFNAAYDRARAAGVEITEIDLKWKDIEISPNLYDGNIGLLLSTLNTLVVSKGMKIALILKPVDGSEKAVPADLASVSFSDTMMIGRYNRMQKFVLNKFTSAQIHSYTIGLNVGGYTGTNATLINDYSTFYSATSAYAKSLKTNLKMGINLDWFSATYYNEALTLNQNTDYVSVAYTPSNIDYTVRPTSQVEGDLNNLVAKFSTKPIYLQHTAYPSSTVCNSTTTAQKDFITTLFATWDKKKDNIKYISYFTAFDFSQQQVDDIMAAANNTNPVAKEYLKTVGLNLFTGEEKSAMAEFRNQAKSRGW